MNARSRALGVTRGTFTGKGADTSKPDDGTKPGDLQKETQPQPQTQEPPPLKQEIETAPSTQPALLAVGVGIAGLVLGYMLGRSIKK